MEKKTKKPIVPEDDAFLELDEFALHTEWKGQAKLYQKYSRKLARCIKDLEDAENDLELVDAQLSVNIRDDPETYGLRKATDKSVEAAVIVHHSHQEAVALVSKAKYNKQLLIGTCKALEQRRDAIEGLVKLHFGDYYADPKLDQEDREAVDETEKRRVRNRGRQ